MGDWSQEAFAMPEVVQSVVKCVTNGPLLAAVAQLWIKPTDLVVDMTYGRGHFWTVYRPARLVAHDLITDGVDFRHLPEADGSVDVAVFDPPYISMGGRETSTLEDEFMERYGLVDAPKTATELAALIDQGIREGARILAPKGRLMVKCMDYVDSDSLFLGRHLVVNTALGLGLKQADEFVHHSGTGPQPKFNLDGSLRKQHHARRAHSYLCVFQAPGTRRRGCNVTPPGNGSEVQHIDGDAGVDRG